MFFLSSLLYCVAIIAIILLALIRSDSILLPPRAATRKLTTGTYICD